MKRVIASVAVLAAVLTVPGCTKQQLQGQASSYLILDSIVAARGNEPDKDLGVLDSDVVTAGSIYADLGKVTFRLAMKDPGTATTPSVPTQANFITVTRYH